MRNKLFITISAFSLLVLSASVMSKDKNAEKKDSKDTIKAEKNVKDSNGIQEVSKPISNVPLSPSEMERRGRLTR